MDADFEDIRIVDLDLSRTTWSRVHDSLRVMFLRLDRVPPDNDWPRLFFEERESRIVARRRGLWIEDDYISFDSLPEEVEKIHLPDIRQSLNYANRKYRELAAQRQRKRLDTLAEQRSERDEMLALQARLRGMFDGAQAPAEAPATRAEIAPVVVPESVPDAVAEAAAEPVAPPPADARDVLDEFEVRRNALKQAFRNAASQDKEQK
ncbi:MAG TPA: hypothetical protein VLF18_17545 [Tahibacter sp.]|uniref:hypothetical protein n=1 Tax=Tahibacter sp. TaxID=2056211 RepID=UPI002C19E09E|nr:hypothetical protein [Tahibacter sp.]HSX61995.1 hypothetical protein [Tahibacter sp.]